MEKVGTIFRQSLANNIKEGIKNNKSIFLVSYSALSVPQMSSLRKNLSRLGAEIFVPKNRVARIVFKELNQEKLGTFLSGQSALIWTNADSVTVSKALVKFTEENQNVSVSGALLDGKTILAKDDVKRLSELPSREVLLAQLLSVIQSPLTRLAGVLNAKSRDLLSILKQLSEKKGGKSDG